MENSVPTVRPRGRARRLSLAAFAAAAFATPSAPLDPLTAQRLPSRRTDVIERFEAALEGTPFRLVETIWNLDGRYGCFADLDGDGDQDYVATEMVHGREPLATHLKSGDRWHRESRITRPFNQKHPMDAWVVPAYRRHPPAILLPVGWSPYFYLIPTDGRGRLRRSGAKSLAKYLPRRISKSIGVDNCPYRVLRIDPGDGRNPPVVHGLLLDSNGRGKHRIRGFRLAIDGRNIRARHGPAPRSHWSRIMDWENARRPIEKPAEHPADSAAGRRSALRRDTVRYFTLDVNADGVDDLVQITGDLAAHVFLGKKERTNGKLVFEEKERTPPRGLPIDWATLHGWNVAESDLVGRTGMWYELLGFDRRLYPGARAPIGLSSERSSGLVYHTWDGERMVAHLRRVRFVPRDENGKPRWRRASWSFRDVVEDDFDGNGIPEVLTVLTVAAEDEVDKPSHRSKRHALLAYWAPSGPEASTDRLPRREQARLLLEFPVLVTEPANQNRGRPLTLSRIRVAGSDRSRYCVYFRPWKLGLFLERK